jgi:hypothetical protein
MPLWTQHTDRSRQDASILRSVFDTLGWKLTAVAAMIGVNEKDFLRQLAGRDGLNHWRLQSLGDDFQREYQQRVASLRGARILEPHEIQLVRGFAQMDRPHMLKLTQPEVTLYDMDKEIA